ncbi:MAG: SDR family oxidoreductase [Chitinophagaceae bacterium]|nr:SDR family oxidoreductase [Chitinophagaceae bacterium]
MLTLENKVIVITGASKGIGKALALQLCKHSSKLALLARSKTELEILQQEILLAGGIAEIFVGNVSDEAFVQHAIQSTITKFGIIDIVINNAGFGVFKQADETAAEEWDNVFATNVKGTFLVSKAATAVMKQNKSGHIINIASDVAKRVFAGGALYCASKYAQDAYSMALRKELREFGIKVSVVYSGLVDSQFHIAPQGDESHKDWLKVEDMANAIMYIASQPKHVVIDELMIHPLSQDY